MYSIPIDDFLELFPAIRFIPDEKSGDAAPIRASGFSLREKITQDKKIRINLKSQNLRSPKQER